MVTELLEIKCKNPTFKIKYGTSSQLLRSCLQYTNWSQHITFTAHIISHEIVHNNYNNNNHHYHHHHCNLQHMQSDELNLHFSNTRE